MYPTTYSPPNHTEWGYMGDQGFLNQSSRNLGACPRGRWVEVDLSVHVQDVHYLKEAIAFKVPLILVMPMTRFNVDLEKIEDETFTPVATKESPLFLFFFMESEESTIGPHK